MICFFRVEKKKWNSWVTENKQEFDIMTTDIQCLTQIAE